MAGLVVTVPPTSLVQWAFLGLLLVATFAFMLLLLRAYYRRRLSAQERRKDPQRPGREALMVAGFVAYCAWLQTLRILTLTNALLLLGVLAFAEAFYVSRVE
jgi:hypothetical protein